MQRSLFVLASLACCGITRRVGGIQYKEQHDSRDVDEVDSQPLKGLHDLLLGHTPAAGWQVNHMGPQQNIARNGAQSYLARSSSSVQMAKPKGPAIILDDMSPAQNYGPTKPAHAWIKPWTNLETQEAVQLVKQESEALRQPLGQDMENDEIFVSDKSIHILKHHGSYMQQDRTLKGAAKKKSYQFMLRLKVPCGEVPGALYAELDDISNKWGQGDLRATTRQAFQIHGVLKGNLKKVIAAIANFGSNTYGGCGDINRNIMTPPVHFPNNPAYVYCQQYSRAISELFKPMTEAFTELWLDGEKALETEYWQRDIGHFNLDKVRDEDRGNGIITGHPIEPLYGKTYLPKKFKIAMTVPGDNGVDIYINDVGCVVIMKPDGVTLDGFNIMVGGGMGRTHKKETTFARAASHLGFVPKEHFFEAMKAILATQRDHGNREVRANARLKYLVHTLGIDDFRVLCEKYFGQKFEPWRPLPEWKYLDWMGWNDQGDGKWMFGFNVEQGRVRDVPGLQIKTGLRKLVDTYPGIDLLLTASQSIVLRNVEPSERDDVENLLKDHGIKTNIDEIDQFTRKSIACPAFPLCGLAMTEAERVQPEINARLYALVSKMGLEHLSMITRTTGCPNGCARPYMAELAFVGSGKNQYQVWLGGSPSGSERTAFESHMYKMKFENLEQDLEPIFAMYKKDSHEGEAFGDFCWRVGKDAIEQFCNDYTTGDYEKLTPLRTIATDATIGMDSKLLAIVEEQGKFRGYDPAYLVDKLYRDTFGIKDIEQYSQEYTPGSYEKSSPVKTVAVDTTVGIDSKLLAIVEKEAEARGYDPAYLMDKLIREAFGIDE